MKASTSQQFVNWFLNVLIVIGLIDIFATPKIPVFLVLVIAARVYQWVKTPPQDASQPPTEGHQCEFK